MKKILTLCITILLTSQLFSQIKISSMMKIIKMNYDQFEEFNLNNGWNLEEIKNTKNVEGVTYKKGSGLNGEFITLYKKFFNEFNHVTFQTSKRENYSIIKNELKTIGFKLIRTETKDNTIRYDYRRKINDNLDLELSIYQVPPNHEEKIFGGWEINLSQIFVMEKFILDTPK